MRKSRLILDSSEVSAHYHVMSRCVNGEPLLDDIAREKLRCMIWKVAEFCNIEVVTYAVLSNHFHVLLQVPMRTAISDEELLRRYRMLHPTPSPYRPERIEVIADWLNRNSREGIAWRQQQLSLMFDLPSFVKLLKQRFTIWFNAHYNRFGTLWAERYKSVLVDYESDALTTMAAYIDLNAVRKGIVSDPKDYRWCGYAEALAGSRRARQGLAQITHENAWSKSQRAYRLLLYSTAASPRINGNSIDTAAFQSVIDANGNIPLPELLRHQWAYFTYGSVLGNTAFVQRHRDSSTHHHSAAGKAAPRRRNPSAPKTAPYQANASSIIPPPSPPPPPTPWGGWATAHHIKRT